MTIEFNVFKTIFEQKSEWGFKTKLNKNKPLAPLCQACVFDFGNEFCRRDPEPGQRKIMMVNVTCVQENIIKDQEKVN